MSKHIVGWLWRHLNNVRQLGFDSGQPLAVLLLSVAILPFLLQSYLELKGSQVLSCGWVLSLHTLSRYLASCSVKWRWLFSFSSPGVNSQPLCLPSLPFHQTYSLSGPVGFGGPTVHTSLERTQLTTHMPPVKTLLFFLSSTALAVPGLLLLRLQLQHYSHPIATYSPQHLTLRDSKLCLGARMVSLFLSVLLLLGFL